MFELSVIGMPGFPEMMVILVILLVLFGGAKLPTLMRNLGRSAKEFKQGLNDPLKDDEDSEAANQ